MSNVDGGTINCTCHNSKFAITDGSVKQGPATKPLAAKELKVERRPDLAGLTDTGRHGG